MIASHTRHYCLVLLMVCFALPGTLAAQGSKPLPTSESVPEASQKSAQPQPIGILADTQGVDFGPYLSDLRSRLNKSWFSLLPKDAFNGANGQLVIEFEVRRDGDVAGMKLVAPTGNSSLDRAAWDAIKAASPFLELPKDFKGDSLTLRGVFCYNSACFDQWVVGFTAPLVVVEAKSVSAQPVVDTTGQDSATSVLCVQGVAQTTVGHAEIVGDTKDADLYPYLDASVLPVIRANWYRLVSKSGEKTAGDATVEFTVLKDGSVTSAKLTDGAGHAILGDLALKAVEKSAPLAALPAQFPGQSVAVRVHLAYAPRPTQDAGVIRITSASQLCRPDADVSAPLDCVHPPRVLFNPDPEYTYRARENKRQGIVAVSMVVAEDGSVQNACAAQPLGDGLEQKAVETVRTWKFEPATINGKARAMQILVEVDFHLYEKDESKLAKP